MDRDILVSDFIASELGYPSSSTQIPSDYQLSKSINHGMGYYPVPHEAKATKLRPILGSEWSQIKKLLQYLYIEKGQTLKTVQRYLKEKHNLIVTEKQLTRKFSEWNLKKNVKSGERKTLVQEYHVTQNNQLGREGRGKIAMKKLIRWEKEITSSPKPNLHLCPDERLAVVDSIKVNKEMLKKIHISEQMELLPEGTDSNLSAVDGQEEDSTILIAKLFAKLGLEAPEDTNSWQAKVETAEETKASFSDSVPFASIHPSISHGSSTCPMVTIRPLTPERRPECTHNQRTYSFKWDNIDVMFSTGLLIEPSPYNELYPFTADSQSAQNGSALSSVNSLFCPTNFNLQESLSKIEKLRKLCQANHKGLVAEMLTVAQFYLGKFDYLNAEHWHREVVQYNPSTMKLHPMWVLSRFQFSYILSIQGKSREAKKEHQAACQLLSDSNIIDEKITEASLVTGGCIAAGLEENQDSERWFKQFAQRRLTNYGPHSKDTMWALQCLIQAFMSQRKYSESQELLWILIDLAKKDMKPTDRETTEVTCLLAETMFEKGRFKEAEIWWRTSLQIAEKNWGNKDSITLRAEIGLAMTLKSQNRLAESERLLHSNVENCVKAEGENSVLSLRPMMVLGFLLLEDGRYEDAKILLEKCFKICLRKLGPIDTQAFDIFSCLVDCYFCMGRCDKILDLIREWLGAIKKVCENHKYVSLLETLLEDIGVESSLQANSDMGVPLVWLAKITMFAIDS